MQQCKFQQFTKFAREMTKLGGTLQSERFDKLDISNFFEHGTAEGGEGQMGHRGVSGCWQSYASRKYKVWMVWMVTQNKGNVKIELEFCEAGLAIVTL